MGGLHGLTDPKTGDMYIREDVYNGACQGKGRDRFTIGHEFAHLLLHDNLVLGLARVDKNIKVEIYRDPEWQANVFAGEFLIPTDCIGGMFHFYAPPPSIALNTH